MFIKLYRNVTKQTVEFLPLNVDGFLQPHLTC